MSAPVLARAETDEVYGVLLTLFPTDPRFSFEIRRAPDAGGTPNLAAIEIIGTTIQSERVFQDRLPNDGLVRWYSVRQIFEGEEPGVWLGWLSAVPKIQDALVVAQEAIVPTFREQAVRSGSTGTLTIQVNDPQLRIVSVAMRSQAGSDVWGDWYTIAAPYTMNVALLDSTPSRIAYRIDYYDARAVVQQVEAIVPLDADPAANVYNPTITFLSTGEVVVSINGDAETFSSRVSVGIGSTPTDPTLFSIALASRSGSLNTGFFCSEGAEAIVKVAGVRDDNQLGPVALARAVRPTDTNTVTPLDPEIQIVPVTNTLTTESFNLVLALGLHATGTLQYRYRVITAYLAPDEFPAYTTYSTPVFISVTRLGRSAKSVDIEVTDGVRVTRHREHIEAKLDFLSEDGVRADKPFSGSTSTPADTIEGRRRTDTFYLNDAVLRFETLVNDGNVTNREMRETAARAYGGINPSSYTISVDPPLARFTSIAGVGKNIDINTGMISTVGTRTVTALNTDVSSGTEGRRRTDTFYANDSVLRFETLVNDGNVTNRELREAAARSYGGITPSSFTISVDPPLARFTSIAGVGKDLDISTGKITTVGTRTVTALNTDVSSGTEGRRRTDTFYANDSVLRFETLVNDGNVTNRELRETAARAYGGLNPSSYAISVDPPLARFTSIAGVGKDLDINTGMIATVGNRGAAQLVADANGGREAAGASPGELIPNGAGQTGNVTDWTASNISAVVSQTVYRTGSGRRSIAVTANSQDGVLYKDVAFTGSKVVELIAWVNNGYLSGTGRGAVVNIDPLAGGAVIGLERETLIDHSGGLDTHNADVGVPSLNALGWVRLRTVFFCTGGFRVHLHLGYGGNVTGTSYFVVSARVDNDATRRVMNALDTNSRLSDPRRLNLAFTANAGSYQSVVPITAGYDQGISNYYINVAAHTLHFPEGVTVSYAARAVVGVTSNNTYWMYYDDPDLLGGTLTLGYTQTPSTLMTSGRYFLGKVTVPVSSSSPPNSGTGGGGDGTLR